MTCMRPKRPCGHRARRGRAGRESMGARGRLQAEPGGTYSITHVLRRQPHRRPPPGASAAGITCCAAEFASWSAFTRCSCCCRSSRSHCTCVSVDAMEPFASLSRFECICASWALRAMQALRNHRTLLGDAEGNCGVRIPLATGAPSYESYASLWRQVLHPMNPIRR